MKKEQKQIDLVEVSRSELDWRLQQIEQQTSLIENKVIPFLMFTHLLLVVIFVMCCILVLARPMKAQQITETITVSIVNDAPCAVNILVYHEEMRLRTIRVEAVSVGRAAITTSAPTVPLRYVVEPKSRGCEWDTYAIAGELAPSVRNIDVRVAFEPLHSRITRSGKGR